MEPAASVEKTVEAPPVPGGGGGDDEPPSLLGTPTKDNEEVSPPPNLSENLPEEKTLSDNAAQQAGARSQSGIPEGENHSAEAQPGDIETDGMPPTDQDSGTAVDNTGKACVGPDDMDGIIIDWKAAVAEAKNFKQSRQPRVPNKEHVPGELRVCFPTFEFLDGKKKPIVSATHSKKSIISSEPWQHRCRDAAKPLTQFVSPVQVMPGVQAKNTL